MVPAFVEEGRQDYAIITFCSCVYGIMVCTDRTVATGIIGDKRLLRLLILPGGGCGAMIGRPLLMPVPPMDRGGYKEVQQQEACCYSKFICAYPVQSSYFNNVANIGSWNGKEKISVPCIYKKCEKRSLRLHTYSPNLRTYWLK